MPSRYRPLRMTTAGLGQPAGLGEGALPGAAGGQRGPLPRAAQVIDTCAVCLFGALHPAPRCLLYLLWSHACTCTRNSSKSGRLSRLTHNDVAATWTSWSCVRRVIRAAYSRFHAAGPWRKVRTWLAGSESGIEAGWKPRCTT